MKSSLNSVHHINYQIEEFYYDKEYLCIDVEIEFDYTEEEPMIKYHRDGSGYPGYPETFEINGCDIKRVTGEESEIAVTKDLEKHVEIWLQENKEVILEFIKESRE